MTTQANPVPHLRPVIGIVGAILLGASALAAVTARWQMSSAVTAGVSIPDLPRARHLRFSCEECGVVSATREIAQRGRAGDSGRAISAVRGERNQKPGTKASSQEVTVRMRNGSSHIFIETTTVHWRPGERIILIVDAG
jgi:hypothetical protein